MFLVIMPGHEMMKLQSHEAVNGGHGCSRFQYKQSHLQPFKQTCSFPKPNQAGKHR